MLSLYVKDRGGGNHPTLIHGIKIKKREHVIKMIGDNQVEKK